MKSFITQILCTVLTLFAMHLHADDQKTDFDYVGKITGLYCSACASKVKAALSHLDGVTNVKITRTKELGVQQIHMKSSSPSLTKDAAIKALGEDAKSYTILSLDRSK